MQKWVTFFLSLEQGRMDDNFSAKVSSIVPLEQGLSGKDGYFSAKVSSIAL